jgi:hypothetical protein
VSCGKKELHGRKFKRRRSSFRKADREAWLLEYPHMNENMKEKKNNNL